MSGAKISRRAMLAGLGAVAGQLALAEAPRSSLWPVPRPGQLPEPAARRARDVLAEVGLPGRSAFVVADARTGEILDRANPLLALPCASVAKFVTALYALDTFGPTHSFATKIVATAPMLNGRIDGDLVLVGGGDPMLDSDELGAMARGLVDMGLREVTGRLLVHRGPLPHQREIDPGQPVYVGYNPAVSGLNLNYNRVYFEWEKGGDVTRMEARGANYSPPIPITPMQVVDRSGPVFDYQRGTGVDRWSVARGALRQDGARWLPVRNPALYAGHALRGVLTAAGVLVRPPEMTQGRISGVELIQHRSMPMERIVRSMLYYSTNLVAEVIGMNASVARGGPVGSIGASARRMNDWMVERMGARRPRFVDHSGLGDGARVTANDLVMALIHEGPDSLLANLMRKFPMPKEAGNLQVVAKTGTLNFVSGLAGFVKAGRRDLAFAILSADLQTRAAVAGDGSERPPGARGWSTRARYQDAQLIMDWAKRFRR